MKKTVLIIMAITLLSKIIGFGREMVLSYFYGASNISDAYLIANSIPTLIMSFILQSITAIYIPQYDRIQHNNGVDEADKYTSNLINILFLLLTVIVFISIFFAETIVKILAAGFDAMTLELTISFMRVTIFSSYFILLTRIFSAYLQIKNAFFITTFIGIPYSIVVIITLVASTHGSIFLLPVGIVLSAILQVIFLIPFLLKKGYKHRVLINFTDNNIKEMLLLSVPVFVCISVTQINFVVERTIASQITQGGISVLIYAKYLNDFIVAIFALSLSTVFFPNISKMVASNNLQALKKTLRESFTLINITIIPATIGMMLFSLPIVEVVYKRGAFDSADVALTSSALHFYSLGMLGEAFRIVLSNFFFSLGDTKTPNITNVIAVITNIILNIVLSPSLGIGGLALASSFSTISATGIMFIRLRKKIGAFGMTQLSISFLKILVASLLMGALSKVSFNYLSLILSPNLSILIAIAIGGGSYFIIMHFMKIEDVNLIIEAVKKKLGKGSK